MKYILAIDQGTHASRALLLDLHGRIVSRSGSRKIALLRPAPGRVEQDAEEIVQSVRDAIDEALQPLPARERARLFACGLATQRSTVVSWKKDGSSLSPAINWQDTRGSELTGQLTPKAAADIRRRSGLPLSPHYGASKLNWLLKRVTKPDETLAGPLASFLLYRLTEHRCYCVDHSNAQRMQLLDLHTLDWSVELSKHFGVPLEWLPQCRPVVSTYGMLAGYRIPITAVCGDQNAAWSGGGEADTNTAMINLGSGAFILADLPETAGEQQLLTSIAWSSSKQCRFLLEGTVNGAGNALSWFRDHYRIRDLEHKLPQWLQTTVSPPLFVNTIGGLGSPWWQSGPQAGFINDHGKFSLAEQAAGIVESIVFLLQHNLERIRACRPIQRLRVSGGLSQLDSLCQKLSDLSNTPVERSDDAETSARGIAWLAAGQPAEWQNDRPKQQFQPADNEALRNRYRTFTTHLRQRLATRDDG